MPPRCRSTQLKIFSLVLATRRDTQTNTRDTTNCRDLVIQEMFFKDESLLARGDVFIFAEYECTKNLQTLDVW